MNENPLSPSAAPLSEQTKRERIDLLYRLVPRSSIVNLLMAALSARALWNVVPHAVVLEWLGAVCLATALRVVFLHLYRRSLPQEETLARWENLFSAGAGAMGLAWTWLALIGPLPEAHRILVVLVIGGMAVGAAGTMGASRKAFLCFAAPMLTTQIGVLFWIGGELFTVMALMSLVFSFGLVAVYSEFRATLFAALEARLNMEKLHQQQRLVFDTARVGIAFLRDRKVIDCNLWMGDALGYRRDELKGASTRLFMTSDKAWEDLGVRLYDTLKQGVTYREELALRKKNGEPMVCDVSIECLVQSRPELGLVAIFNDISARKQVERELQKTLQQQLAIFDNAVAGIVYLNKHIIENCNSRFARLFGYTRDEMVGAATRIFHLSDQGWERNKEKIFNAISKGEAYSFDEEFVRKDGTRFWCRSHGRAIDPLHPDYAVFVMLDITEQVNAERELRASRDRLNLVIEAAQSGIWDFDVARGITHYSPRFKTILGFPPDADFDTVFKIHDRLHPDDRSMMLDAQRRHLDEHTPFACEYRLRKADGGYVWVSGRGQAVWDESGKPVRFVGSITDISRQKEDEERIRSMAQHDPLTDLPNRRLLNDRLGHALQRARRSKGMLALMLLDLDDFKAINDSGGHEVGDMVLASVAQRLRDCVRATDTVARYGGDEFVILLEGQQAREDSMQLAQKIIAALGKPIPAAQQVYTVGASIGIALYPEDSKKPDDLLNLADKAMYRVKEEGGNQYRFAADQVT